MSIQAFVAKKYDVEYADMCLAGSAVVDCINDMYDYNEDIIVHSNAWDFDMYVLDGTDFELSRKLLIRYIKESERPHVDTAKYLLESADRNGDVIHVMIN